MVVNLYAVFSALSCCLLAVQWFNKLFRSFTINVRPLHPDGAGGLSPLGAFALRLSYPITLIGFILVLTPMTRQYLIDGSFRISLTGDIVAGLVLYAAFAPFVFFAPLAAAHSSMKQARFGTLLRLANQFDREYLNLEAGLAHSAKPAHARLQRISLLRSMYNEVRRFPVWPFNSDNLARFATSTVSPIALAVLGDATSRLFIG